MTQHPLTQSKALRRLLSGVLVLLAVWLLAWLALPSVLKQQIEERASAQLGRTVTVGAVDIKPWSLEVTLDDVSLAHAQPATGAQFSFKRLHLNVHGESLWRLMPVVESITLASPKLELTRLASGGLNIDDMLARLQANPSAPSTQPTLFDLSNVSLFDGNVVLNDELKGQQHHLQGLTLKLPFLSNVVSQRDVQVLPELAFDLNGSHFGTTAQTTPFADSRKTAARFTVNNLDLAPYLPYLPNTLPLKLASAVVNAELTLEFEQTPLNVLHLSGQVSASQVKVVPPTQRLALGAPLLAFDQLSVELLDVQPFQGKVALGKVAWRNPSVQVQRQDNGALNWQALLSGAESPSKSRAPEPTDTGARGKKDAPPPWSVSVADLAVSGGQVRWSDLMTRPAAALSLDNLALTAQGVQWPMQTAVPFEGNAQLSAAKLKGAAALSFKGKATDQSAQVTSSLANMSLGLVAPYVAQSLKPQLSGLLNAQLSLDWQAATSPQAPGRLTVAVPSLSLQQLALRSAAPMAIAKADKASAKPSKPSLTALASVERLTLSDTVVDLVNRQVNVGPLQIQQPRVSVGRGADGRWMVEDWLAASTTDGKVNANSKPAAASPPTPAAKPWRVTLANVGLTKGTLHWSDAVPAKPVQLSLTEVSAQLKNLSTQGSQQANWRVAAKLQHGHTEPGLFSAQGNLGMTPLAVQADLNLVQWPLHAFEPYFAPMLNVSLVRADGSYKGQLKLTQQPQGLAFQVRGNANLDDVRVDTLAQTQPFKPAEELLSWRDLRLTGLAMSVTPGDPTQVEVAQTELDDFYARLTLSEAGRFNLQNIMVTQPDEAALASTSPPAVVQFGPVRLGNGRVDFTDRFIQPNYATHLSELNGQLSAFSSQAASGEVQLADLTLRGRAEGTATLEVLGKLNPLAKPLALDIQGHVRDLELPPLSPYAVRYAGYGIERGKLSVDVAYKVQPDGQLTATNKLVLNQLTFGDKVPGAENSLPVKLAVALLADRHGVIDIDLPISGSLNDPQFRMGPIIFKAVVNLIVRAITAPFSLLAGAFGGDSDQLSSVAFAPGSAKLTPEARANLDKVAKALQDRPSLKMTVVGTASLDQERDAFKRAQLNDLVKAEKRRTLSNPSREVLDTLTVSPLEYPDLLKTVYKRADFPKPRNMIGMTKELPVPDMETLMLANLSVTDAAIQNLAEQRGVAVRDHLAALKLPLERLFLGAAKAVTPDANWQPQAELNLTTQ